MSLVSALSLVIDRCIFFKLCRLCDYKTMYFCGPMVSSHFKIYFSSWFQMEFLFVCLVVFLTSSSTTRLYRGRAPRQSVWQFYVLPHMRQSWETMTSISAGHIILTPTQPVGSGRPQQGSSPGPPDQESRALPTELPRPPPPPPPPPLSDGRDLFNQIEPR